jgi:hypothetical protein
MRLVLICAALCALAAVLPAAEPAPPAFTKKPAAAKAGDKVKIEFAVDRETDVSVFIEDAGGKVVRHLVSGVLGKNPPPPLSPGLAQSVEWDGKGDWGKPAGSGPFKVRVAIGLGARYDRVVAADPMVAGQLKNIAVGPDGTLYAAVDNPHIAHFAGQRLVALNRDGSYQRTLIPPPANATAEQIKALGGIPLEIGGRTVPVVTQLNYRRNTDFQAVDGMAVTPSGQLLALHFNPQADAVVRIGLVDTTGEKSPPPFLGAPLLPGSPNNIGFNGNQRQFVAASGDGKYAYMSGLAERQKVSTDNPRQWSAVYRAKLPERSPAEPFFGDPDKTGNDETHLGGATRGMAADGNGNLLICDPANKRVVVVSEADKKFAGSFPAENPEFVAADKKTGVVYLLNRANGGTADVVKMGSWKDPKPLASINLKAPRTYLQWWFAVDTSAKPAVLWASNGMQLIRFEDLGATFSDAKIVGADDTTDYVNLTVDHYRPDPEVYVRRGCNSGWVRYNETTDKTEKFAVAECPNSAGAGLEVGPDGNLYIQRWPQFLFKCDRNGKALKWDAPFTLPAGVKPYGSFPNAIGIHVCMVYQAHTHGIRSDGHHFVFEAPFAAERGSKALYEFAPSGERIGGPIIWKVSDFVVGPRFDQAGNIYIAEHVRPADAPIPPEFAGVVGPVKPGSRWDGLHNPKRNLAIMHGSIIKFSPKGGMIDFGTGRYGPGKNAVEGPPKLDPLLKTVEMAAFAQVADNTNDFCAAKVTGAEWVHFGISDVPQLYCNCENVRFDVDPFGRVWYPDLGRYRVGVLDTNGNAIMTFGGYGNAESAGPDSAVLDPKTGLVRPRKADDPKDLKSPFAEPEIAFSWLTGVGATDRYVYMGDTVNRRLLRAKIVYAAEEICDVR